MSLTRDNVKRPGKGKIILTWALVMGSILLFSAIGFFSSGGRMHTRSADEHVGLGQSIFLFAAGVFFLVTGIVSYLVVWFTNCVTFDFTQPVWGNYKTKIYFANIFVPVQWMLAVGFTLAAVVSPILSAYGFSGQVAWMAPIFVSLFAMQICLIWVRVWGPLARRLIQKRLQALGITPEQLQTGFYTGLSNPAQSSFKKLGAIEDDIGMLWFNQDQMIYWGDTERWAITPQDLISVEMKADAGSTSMLSGTAHVILHLRLPDGSERQIRLHAVGFLTLGRTRAGMDALAEQIDAWMGPTQPAAPQY